MQLETLESYFELYRGSSSMEDYLTLHDLAWSDATEQCGLSMNDVGRSFFLLKGAQLSDRQSFDL